MRIRMTILKSTVALLAVGTLVLATACTATGTRTTRRDKTAKGAGIGAAAGAVLGAVIGEGEADDILKGAAIGAGIGGLTAGALLASRGLDVLVVEQHYIPGGCVTAIRRKDTALDVGAAILYGWGEPPSERAAPGAGDGSASPRRAARRSRPRHPPAASGSSGPLRASGYPRSPRPGRPDR